jgi:hypothetical protein
MVSIRGDQFQPILAELYTRLYEKYNRPETTYDKIFDVVQTKGAFTNDTTLTAVGDLVTKNEGDDIVFERPGGGRVVVGKNITKALGLEFTQEQVDDYGSVAGFTDIVAERAAQFGDSLIRTKEKFGADFMNKGGFTSGDPIFNNSVAGVVIDPSGNLVYDGKPFFNLSGNLRSSLNGGTYYNGHALALSATNLQTVYTHMVSTSAFDETDERISIRPTTLYIHPALKFTAENILQANNIVGSANNDINPMRGIVSVIENPYLTDTDAWFLGTPKEGLKWANRQEPIIDFFQDPRNKNYCVTITCRFGAWVNNWRPWAGSNFSTS